MPVSLFIYRHVFAPILIAVFYLLGLFSAKIRDGLKMRETGPDGVKPWLKARAGSKPVWIHCASGEFEYAKPVIAELKRRHPELSILVTYFSPSIAQAAGRFSGVAFACPTPWENAREWAEFLEYHRPRALLIARTDTWPEMLLQTKARKIPTLLFSATLTESSGRARGPGRTLSRAVFQLLDAIYCVSEADVRAFQSLGLAQALAAGDTRFDQVQARLKNPKPLKEELFSPESKAKTLVAGSTWSEDEAVLAQVARDLGRDARFVFVPHEPTDSHLQELEARLESLGLKSTRYSKATEWHEDEILLVDQVGILAELYQKGRFAFVGGSYRKTVHSVMEPLAAGALTFVGPLHQNNREALEFAKIALVPDNEPGAGSPPASAELTAVQPAADAGTFAALLRRALSEFSPAASQQILNEISARSGKSWAVVDWVEQHSL